MGQLYQNGDIMPFAEKNSDLSWTKRALFKSLQIKHYFIQWKGVSATVWVGTAWLEGELALQSGR